MRFIITTHDRLDGVFLSKPGHFGNVPYADDAAAVLAARVIAGGVTPTVERKRVRRRHFA